MRQKELIRELSSRRIALEASVGHELGIEAGRQVRRLGTDVEADLARWLWQWEEGMMRLVEEEAGEII